MAAKGQYIDTAAEKNIFFMPIVHNIKGISILGYLFYRVKTLQIPKLCSP